MEGVDLLKAGIVPHLNHKLRISWGASGALQDGCERGLIGRVRLDHGERGPRCTDIGSRSRPQANLEQGFSTAAVGVLVKEHNSGGVGGRGNGRSTQGLNGAVLQIQH